MAVSKTKQRPPLTTSEMEAARKAEQAEQERRAEAERVADELAARRAAAVATTTAEAEADDEAIDFGETVLTKRGLPDMRFLSNRQQFMFDQSHTVNGRPDQRLLQNRPDIQQYRKQRQQNRANLIFTDDGHLKENARTTE